MVHEVRWPDGRVVPISEEEWAAARWFRVVEGVYDVRIGQRNFRVERTAPLDPAGRVVLRIQGVSTEVRVADRRRMLLEKMGMAAAAAGVERELLAPMPGKVLSVAVAPGTAVQEGDAVAVLAQAPGAARPVACAARKCSSSPPAPPWARPPLR
jgi:acetyl/propionyl-CoA carboxylase alpha subunit